MTPLERILDALERAECKPRRSGDGWIARCPAHDDHDPSLSVNAGDNGGAVMYCHAGCPTERVAAALGLEMSALMPDDSWRCGPNSKPKSNGKPKPSGELQPSIKPTEKANAPPPVSPDALGVPLTPRQRAALAAELGLPEAVLDEMDVHWSDAAIHHAAWHVTGAYTFPEYDGYGHLIGISYRFPQAAVADVVGADGVPIGNKSALAGSKRGLSLPIAWREMPDPVLIVEGPSDVLAARAVGLSAVGRPSNHGGVDFLDQLCCRRSVIIIGENDRKPDGRWPGKEGAEAVARRLEAKWHRPVWVAYPPEGVKDLRDWVRQLVPAWEDADLSAARESILDAIRPPVVQLLLAGRHRGGRITVKVFRSQDALSTIPIHSDRLHVDDATARKRFVKEVAKLVPEADVKQLSQQLLALSQQDIPPRHDVRGDSSPRETVTGLPESEDTPEDRLPVVFVPGGPADITESAKALGKLLDQTGQYYLRSGMVTTIQQDDDGRPILKMIKPAGLASVFEKVARIMEYVRRNGQFVPQEAIFTESAAKSILECEDFQALLPPIRLLSRCPVLIERDGELVQVSGYDRESGILAFGSQAPDVPLEKAVDLLSDLLADFRFATPADRARALAALVTPAMVFGGLLGGRAPVDLGEADESQAGKGYRARLTAAIYGHVVKAITQKKGGVGSLDESFSTALARGYNFISFDNIRGSVNSTALESFLTEETFAARVPYTPEIEIDPCRTIIQLTSNRAEVTPDLANRSSCVRILKQPAGYQFRRYDEGDILDHVRANQPLYLGAVFAVVKAWHAAGKPTTRTTEHDFRAWAGKLDWIMQNIFHAGPLLDGHRQAQVRMVKPVLNWLRDVALVVRASGKLGEWLRTSDLLELISQYPDIEVPGMDADTDLADEGDRKKVLKMMGRRMAQCFGNEDLCKIDAFTIEREEKEDLVNRSKTREYCFQAADNDTPTVASGSNPTAAGQETPTSDDSNAPCAYSCAYAAPIKTRVAPNAPNAPIGSEHFFGKTKKQHVLENGDEKCVSEENVRTHGRNGRNRRNRRSDEPPESAIPPPQAEASPGTIGDQPSSDSPTTPEPAPAVDQAEAKGSPERCMTHVDPSLWRDEPSPSRRGWIRTTCRVCGTWIGDRPAKQRNKP